MGSRDIPIRIFLVAMTVVACGSSTDDGDDDKVADAGGGAVDAGTVDASTVERDAGSSPTPDAGSQRDAGMERDAGTPDAGMEPDAGPMSPVCWSADINLDGIVDMADELLRSGEDGWSGIRGNNFGDIDRDGDVDADDAACITSQLGGPGDHEFLIEPPDANTTAFGKYVGLFDDTVVITSNSRVFVYREVNQAWTLEAELLAPMNEAVFNVPRVGINNDTVIVGDHGSLFVYERTGTTWSFDVKLEPARPAQYFGTSLSFDTDRVVAGSFINTVSVFERGANGWVEHELVPNGGAPESFGSRVDISGDVAIVGAAMASAAFVFRRVGGAWVDSQTLSPPAVMFETFGQQVAAENEMVVVQASVNRSSRALSFVMDMTGQFVGHGTPTVSGFDPELNQGRLFAGGYNEVVMAPRNGNAWANPFVVRVIEGHHRSPTQTSINDDRVAMGLPRVAVQGNSGGVDDNPGAVLIIPLTP